MRNTNFVNNENYARILNLDTYTVQEELRVCDTYEKFNTEWVYLLLFELSRRACNSLYPKLARNEAENLCVDVATNQFLHLRRILVNGIKVSSYYYYMKDKVQRTYKHLYDKFGNSRVFLYDLETRDSRLVKLPSDSYEPEFCLDSNISVSRVLMGVIKHFCRYSSEYSAYNLIVTSTLYCIIFNRSVHLYGLTKRDANYVDTLVRVVKLNVSPQVTAILKEGV
jgi:hypothetical protein